MDGFRLEKNDLRVLSRLRSNSRENLTRMSRRINIPVSTLYDKLKRFNGELITKNTVIVNFKKIGYDLKVTMLLKSPTNLRKELRDFLSKHERINSLYRINNGYDFMAEALFKNMKEFKEFADQIDEFGVNSIKEFFILEELKREDFLPIELIAA